MGKSLGSGPACHLASHRNPSSLILITPYTSIRECEHYCCGNFDVIAILFCVKKEFFVKNKFE